MPRSLESLPVAASTDLTSSFFFGWFFFLGCLFLSGISIWQGKYGPLVLLLLGALGSLYWLRGTYGELAFRKAAYQQGTVIQAEVISLSRQFSALKSEQDYVLWVRPEGTGDNQPLVKIVHSNVGLWNSTNKGDQIVGLEWDGKYFFGESIGIKWK